ncbi:MAG: sel1 repeat family protein [Betaproteobacteria bacterium]|jgi:TPR repeat protein|nr:MAG: sel1 repeat family protein [Betaproteobacteria bacterium]
MMTGVYSGTGSGDIRGKAELANRFGLLLAALLSCWCLSATTLAAEEDAATLSARGDVAYNRGDVMDAIQWYRQAADLGDAHAQVRLGYIYDKAEENEQAVAWYRKAAEQGDPAGQQGLAAMYAAGEGVTRDIDHALSLMAEAAEQDFLPSILLLAATLERGADGVSIDRALSLKYWRQAAELGDQQAMLRISKAYRNGELGLAADETEAARWQKKLDAAKSGVE